MMEKVFIHAKEDNNRVSYLRSVIANNYEIVESFDAEKTKNILEQEYDNLVLFVIDNPSEISCVNELLKFIKERNNYMFSLPVLLLTDLEHMNDNDKYLDYPIVGAITTSDSETIILQRIKNSIKFSNSTSFDDFSNMLTVLPSLIYLKDNKGRYAFCSQHWHHLTDQNKSIRGKTDFDIRKDLNNARLARQSDLEVIHSGVGKNYIIKEEDETGVDYLQIIKEPLKNENDEVYGIIAIINNVTNEELLKQQLREKSITDQLTGLYNRSYFHEMIENQNSLSYPLTIISADCDDLKQINDQFGHSAGDQYICLARDALKRSLPKGSYLFRVGGDEFIALVPNADEDEASLLLGRINDEINNCKTTKFQLSLSVGACSIQDSSRSIESAVKLSDKEMYKNKKNHKISNE